MLTRNAFCGWHCPLGFDESVQTHCIAEAPSAETGTEGAFPIPRYLSGRMPRDARFTLTL